MPPIVSADLADERQTAPTVVPIVQAAASQVDEAPPIIGAANILTPKISSEIAAEQTGDIQQTSGNQLNDRYSIRAPVVSAAPPAFGNQPLAPRSAMPPIVSGNNPVANNPLGKPMVSSPSFIQAPSPFPTQDHSAGASVLPFESSLQQSPIMMDPMGSMGSSCLDSGINQPAVDCSPTLEISGSLFTPGGSAGGGCGGCSSGCNSCNVASSGTTIGQSFINSSVPGGSQVMGCNSCGSAGCSSCAGSSTSACNSCGSGGCYNSSEVDKRFAACGFISRARNYFIMDVLYMTRANGEVNGINLSPIDEFDYGYGARFTVGRRTDAANGREFSYFGTFGIEDGGNVSDAAARIRRRFLPGGTFITDADLAAFTNVTSASERLETNFQSFEYNRVRWGWDVVKVMFGARYVYLEDDYDLTTNNFFGNTGSLSVDAKNHLIGPQIGLEMFYDVGFRWSLSGFGKFGLMLNAYDADVNASSDGFGLVNNGTNDADAAFLVDLGLTAHYQLTSQARLRVGYNMLFLGDVTTADEAFPNFLSPFSSGSLDADDDALFTGLSLGLEFYR